MRPPDSANRLPLVKSIHTPAYKVLVDLLIDARKAAGLTQQELAHRLGRPQSFIAKLEGRERRIDLLEFLSISRVLGIDPCDAVRRVERALPPL